MTDEGPIGTLGGVIVDCADPEELAAFWGAVLGVEIAERLGGDPPRYVDLESAPGTPYVGFQRVPEPRTGKNRLHLDVDVADLEEATARVEALGGSRVPGGDIEENGYRWRVMRDPVGNEFCLIQT